MVSIFCFAQFVICKLLAAVTDFHFTMFVEAEWSRPTGTSSVNKAFRLLRPVWQRASNKTMPATFYRRI
jgi:hypothetical protein